MTPIVTGANIFRAKRILTAAEIRGLATTGILIAPAIPDKTLRVIGAFATFNFQTQVWDFGAGVLAILIYGASSSGATVLGPSADLVEFISGDGQSRSFSLYGSNFAPPPTGSDLVEVQGLPIYLWGTSGNFSTGRATAATVDPANKGLLYALNDTGEIVVPGAGANPIYTVTGVGAGGLVTTVSVAGGTGVGLGGPFSTNVLTGSGDGTLNLTITAVTPLGDGTVEIDVLYEPI